MLVCGRPDGRLTALTTLEASTCLSVNQASSIQSIGGTCESITIGHNRSKLPLSKQAINLKTYRPKFLCEKVLADMDDEERRAREQQTRVKIRKVENTNSLSSLAMKKSTSTNSLSSLAMKKSTSTNSLSSLSMRRNKSTASLTSLGSKLRSSITQSVLLKDEDIEEKSRSSASLLGAYSNLEKDAKEKANGGVHDSNDIDYIINEMIKE